ncbi:MAG: response regulator [Scytonematopsis contorta HA4267-MV1]|jgi:chemosensory pili system protein ChpA (sensor histidine kinase/response regulator)|nr:response regulator [Scytonematopsis contorta HA4267-MV1]
MSHDKELQIQMQFLIEATDYLNTLEEILLFVKDNRRIELQQIHTAMRTIHSIKGGAAMMGFRTLSDLSHRLEDVFAILRNKKNILENDIQLQSLLLNAIDLLRQIVELLSLGYNVDEKWLVSFCYPIFDSLQERLNNETPDNSIMVLPAEDEHYKIIPLLFQTEVEGCLQRLEACLADRDQGLLREEVTLVASELGGLGEMLQISAFTELCESIIQHLDANPDKVEKIAHLALQGWRSSQSLILSNQIDSLPREIKPFLTLAADTGVIQELETVKIEENWQPKVIENLGDIEITPEGEEAPLPITPAYQESSKTIFFPNSEENTIEATTNFPLNFNEKHVNSGDFLEVNYPVDVHRASNEIKELKAKIDNIDNLDNLDNLDKNEQVIETSPEIIIPNLRSEHSETTVRVPVKQLEEINNLFGEITIQRNTLNLQLEKIHNHLENLNKRAKTLEQENHELRVAYDKVTTQVYTRKLILNNEQYQLNDKSESLETDNYHELHHLSQTLMETILHVQEVTTDIELSLEDADQVISQLNKTSKQLQNSLNQVLMRPLSDIVEPFKRALHDMNIEYGKNVQLQVDGGNILIERNILDSLYEPLMHLVRNAFDHGIEDPITRKNSGKSEQGLIEIKAAHQGNLTIITVSDDGRGISLEKIRTRATAMGLDANLLVNASQEELISLIFEPGFSTTEQVTALSGRGVGMDIVRHNLKQVRGEVKVDTRPGVGTTFTLLVPLTLSVVKVLLVESNQMLLAFPIDAIAEIFLMQSRQILHIAGREVLNWQNSMVQLIRLGRFLEFHCPRYNTPQLDAPPAINATSVLVVQGSNHPVAVQVDRCWGEMEVAIRRVEGNISLPAGFSSCTILSNGRVVPLVSANDFLHWITSNETSFNHNSLESSELKIPAFPTITSTFGNKAKGNILIVDDSINVRRFLALTLQKAGYKIEEANDGQNALEKLQGGLQVNGIICDIEMPHLDGFAFLTHLKYDNSIKNIPVIMLTSRHSEKNRHLSLQLGARAYFTKPYNEQELLQTLENIIFASV